MILKAARALVGSDLAIVEPGTLAIEAGSIVAVGEAGGEVIDVGDLTLLPGFIDAHVHVGFVEPLAVLQGGVTTVRDLAWPSEQIYPLAEGSRSPSFAGPLIECVGPMLTTPGGYPSLAGWAPHGTAALVDSLDSASALVAEQVRHGACAIKVALNSQVGPTLNATLLTAICDAAHAHGLSVTAHIYGLEELAKAIASGLDELAHILMSPESIPDEMLSAMVTKDMTVVPTLSIFSGRDLAIAVDNVARFAAAGGRIVYGTDLGNAGPRPGIDRTEIAGMVAAGIDGRGIVEAATVTAARVLGLERKGILGVGYDADIIGVEGDPLARPEDLCNVRFVMREGRLVRRS